MGSLDGVKVAYATSTACTRSAGGMCEKSGACASGTPRCSRCAPRRRTIAMSGIFPLRFSTLIFTPHIVGGFSLGGSAAWVAALLSAELEEGAGGVTISGGSPGECAGGLPPILPPKGELEEGSEGVAASLLDNIVPDECATGGLPPMPFLSFGEEDLDCSIRTSLLIPNDFGTLSRDAGGFVPTLLLSLSSLELEGDFVWSAQPEFPGGFPGEFPDCANT